MMCKSSKCSVKSLCKSHVGCMQVCNSLRQLLQTNWSNVFALVKFSHFLTKNLRIFLVFVVHILQNFALKNFNSTKTSNFKKKNKEKTLNWRHQFENSHCSEMFFFVTRYKHYSKIWMQIINPYSVDQWIYCLPLGPVQSDQWIHSKSSEIIWCIKTHSIVGNTETYDMLWQLYSPTQTR
jgi:hypothetical protein